jgi:hypothetical protein
MYTHMKVSLITARLKIVLPNPASAANGQNGRCGRGGAWNGIFSPVHIPFHQPRTTAPNHIEE